MKRYGIDKATGSMLPWCNCGWRALANDQKEARKILAEHQRSNHGLSHSDVLRADRHRAAA